MYDKEQNEIWQSSGAANTPLGLILGIDFKIENVQYQVEDEIMKKYNSKELTKEELEHLMKHHNNVIKQTTIKWRVKKSSVN